MSFLKLTAACTKSRKLNIRMFESHLFPLHLSYLKHFLDVPDAPLNVVVGDVSKFGCTVSWECPESDGGSPITSYIVELRDRTSVKWSPIHVTKADELSAIINDVIENKEYIFRVRAENKAGVGKPSAASQPVKIMDPIGELDPQKSLNPELLRAPFLPHPVYFSSGNFCVVYLQSLPAPR